MERRTEAFDAGMRRLVSAIGGCRDTLDRCCDRLLDDLLGAGPVDDDVALIALRLATPPPSSGAEAGPSGTEPRP